MSCNVFMLTARKMLGSGPIRPPSRLMLLMRTGPPTLIALPRVRGRPIAQPIAAGSQDGAENEPRRAEEASRQERNKGSRYFYLDHVTGDPNVPFRRLRCNVSDSHQALAQLVAPGSALVRKADYLLDTDNVENCLLSEVVAGGEYVILPPPSDALVKLAPQIKTLQGWQRHATKKQEGEAASRCVAWLRQHGHPDAEPFCSRLIRGRDQEGEEDIVELDAAAVAKGCAVIVEAKHHLRAYHASELDARIQKLRCLAEGGVLSASAFKGKRLLGVLYGESITRSAEERSKLKTLCLQYGIEVWMADGSNVKAAGDGCFVSPYLHFPPMGS